MAKTELLTELKGGRSSFNLTGEALVRDNALQGIQQKEGSTWRHVNSSFGVKTGEGNTVYARIWGGYKTDKPVLKKWDTDNNFVDVKWENRLSEDIVDSLRPSELFRAGFEEDENGKLIVKKFVSEIDFEEYLREHLADGMQVRVSGEVEYSEYNDDIQKRYNIKNVFLARPYKNKEGETVEPVPSATLTQTYILDDSALSKGWERQLEKEGNIIINAVVPQYLSTRKVGDEYVQFKKTIGLPQGIVFKMKDKENEKEFELKKKIINKFFKVKRDKVREIVLINNINEGFEEATGVEINDEMQELIDLGVLTEEDIKKQVTIRGNKVSEIVFSQPAVNKDKDTGDIQMLMDDNKYSPEALIAPFIDGDDDEDDLDDEEDITVSDDEFDKMFS